MKLTEYFPVQNPFVIKPDLTLSGKEIYIRKLTAAQYESYESRLDMDQPTITRATYSIILALCNEDGEPLVDYTNEDEVSESVQFLKSLDLDTFNDLAKEVLKINGWTVEGENESKENFPKILNEDGGSS